MDGFFTLGDVTDLLFVATMAGGFGTLVVLNRFFESTIWGQLYKLAHFKVARFVHHEMQKDWDKDGMAGPLKKDKELDLD